MLLGVRLTYEWKAAVGSMKDAASRCGRGGGATRR
jgi:hypothetical protein